MEILENELKELVDKMNKQSSGKNKIEKETIDNLYSVYPFNKFEYIISHLLATGTITIDQYLDIRSSYLKRNKYLYIYEITAPRTFRRTMGSKPFKRSGP